jgi:hypothetical protein
MAAAMVAMEPLTADQAVVVARADTPVTVEMAVHTPVALD